MRTLILSDLHLGDGGPYDVFGGHAALPALLRASTVEPTRVYLNGDALDFVRAEARTTGLDPERAVRQAEGIVRRWRPVFLALVEGLERGGEVVFRLGCRDAPLALSAVQAVVRRALGERPGVRFERGAQPAVLRVGAAKVLITHGAHADPLERLDYRGLPEDGDGSASFRMNEGARLTRTLLHPMVEQGVALAALVGPGDRGVMAAAAAAPWVFARVIAKAGLEIDWDRLRGDSTRTLDVSVVSADLTAVVEALDLDTVDLAELRAALAGGGPAGVSAWQVRALQAWGRHHAWAAEGAAFDLTPAPGEWREGRRLLRAFEADAVVMGHGHAARWGQRDGLLYVNTGCWLPRLRLPDTADPAPWRALAKVLTVDPRLTGPARRLRLGQFTAALVEPRGRGAVVSLIEWRDGELAISERAGHPCRAVIGAGTTSFTARGPESRALSRPLLVGGDDGRPLLDAGVLPEPGLLFPVSRRPGGWTRELGAPGDPNDLAEQLWGIVVARGRWAHYEPAVAPLVALREAEMDAPAVILEVDPGLVADVPGALEWMREAWQQRPVHQRPAYLLLLGDLDELPLALQQVLASECAVGRLAFASPAEYRAYAEKVVRWAQGPIAEKRCAALLHLADDGSEAVDVGGRAFLKPGAGALTRDSGRPFAAVERVATGGLLPDPEALLRLPELGRPAVLLSLGHTAGPPSGGWEQSERRRRQGALHLGCGVFLEAEAVRTRRFLPGGIWFLFGSFGAATPTASVFSPWLVGVGGREAARIAESVAGRPFVAALPQAALANPEGPLAVIGHADVAWSFGQQVALSGDPALQYYDRVTGVLAGLGANSFGPEGEARPGRVGVALRHHCRVIPHFERALTELRRQTAVDGRHGQLDGGLWLARQDLEGYILLGDPAVHLPLAGAARTLPAVRGPAASVGDRSTVPELLPDQGRETDAEPVHGLVRAAEDALVARFRAAGRAALVAEGAEPLEGERRALAHLRGEGAGRVGALYAEIYLRAGWAALGGEPE